MIVVVPYATIETTEHRPTVIRTSVWFFANSIMGAALGVVIARLVEQLGVAVVGALTGRDPVLTNGSVELRAPGSDLVLLGGTGAALLMGLSLLLLYPYARDRGVGKLTMLWTLLFCFRIGLVDLARTMFQQDAPLARLVERAGFPAGIDVVITATGLVGMVLLAMAAAPAFLGFSRHRSEVSTARERLRFAAAIALLPALAGPLLAVAFLLPDHGSGFVSSLPTFGAFIVLTVVAAAGTRSVAPPRVVEERGLSWGLVAWFVGMLLFFRVVLEPGIVVPPWDENLHLVLRP